MPKHIILCSDGTGNSGGKARGTNVWEVYRSVRRKGADPEQVVFHDDGVGTQKFLPWRLASGAFGFGLAANIQRLYARLVEAYVPGDKIFLFGFSRGAFTVRTLADLIVRFGVQPTGNRGAADVEADIKSMYRRYRYGESNTTIPDDDPSRSIEFLGVWDTVGAVGGPFPAFDRLVNLFSPHKWADQSLSKHVRYGRHALALDDERRTFAPLLWSEKGDDGNDGAAPHVRQVWFAGAHANVGGGYPRDQVAYVSLLWMLCEAHKLSGLQIDRPALRSLVHAADVQGRIYDSRAGIKAFYRLLPRRIANLHQETGARAPIVHESVLHRIGNGTERYAPAFLPHTGDIEFAGVESDPTIASALDCRPDEQALAPLRVGSRRRRQLYWGVLILAALPLIFWSFSGLRVLGESKLGERLGTRLGALIASAVLIAAYLMRKHAKTLVLRNFAIRVPVSLALALAPIVLLLALGNWAGGWHAALSRSRHWLGAVSICEWLAWGTVLLAGFSLLKFRLERSLSRTATDAWRPFRTAYQAGVSGQ